MHKKDRPFTPDHIPNKLINCHFNTYLFNLNLTSFLYIALSPLCLIGDIKMNI